MKKILKFGGKSLSNGKGIEQVLTIIQDKLKNKEKIVITLSARGNATNELETILELAKHGKLYKQQLEAFKSYQTEPLLNCNFSFKQEFKLLDNLIEGVSLLKDYSLKTKDLFLAQGEILAVKTVSLLLNQTNVITIPVDSRDIFVTNNEFGNAKVNEVQSREKTLKKLNEYPINTIPIITGFIASTNLGETTTLGRNGSNYSASLLAKFLNVKSIESYTHVDGIYTANPEIVDNAKIINQLSYKDANELASFGASILHSKTIEPLIQNNIELKIRNTFNKTQHGTIINIESTPSGAKSISAQSDVVLINLKGKGLVGKVGIDGRIFGSLQHKNINVSIISQGSSERGISFVVTQKDASLALTTLKKEFKLDIHEQEISAIDVYKNISVVTIIGEQLAGFLPAYQSLVRNNITIELINNTLSGNNISLIINSKDVKKAVNLIHSQIFGVAKTINVVVFGKGTVGRSLLNQIIKSKSKILTKKETNINVFAVANSTHLLLNKNGINNNWEIEFDKAAIKNSGVEAIINFANDNHLENLIAIDNTASIELVKNYETLVKNGFDLISSNKIANTNSYSDYHNLRKILKLNKKQYLYETNVGAGLPLIDTIKLLHDSDENITKIKGVFSGSLSYLFNEFSGSDDSFSSILKKAVDKGYTEPDSREDLCGNDVARKLLILARELDLQNEFEDISIDNLIPEFLRNGTKADFLNQLDKLNPIYSKIKADQKKGHVLRYIGELHGDLQLDKGILDVKLVSVPKESALGQLSGSDSFFEIYTESYGTNPIVIQGAGAGAEVTARGVFGDLLRIANKK